MKMLNAEIASFVEFLMSFEVAGKGSRMRTRFCKLLTEQMKLIEEERIGLAKQYSEKGEDGEPLIVANESGQENYQMSDMVNFNREYAILMLEEFIVEDTPMKTDMIETVRDLVLNTNKLFSGEAAVQYDRWCTIVEEV